MKAMNQHQVNVQHDEIQGEFEATAQEIASLEAKQAVLQETLYRLNVHQELLSSRNIPEYPSWLPFST